MDPYLIKLLIKMKIGKRKPSLKINRIFFFLTLLCPSTINRGLHLTIQSVVFFEVRPSHKETHIIITPASFIQRNPLQNGWRNSIRTTPKKKKNGEYSKVSDIAQKSFNDTSSKLASKYKQFEQTDFLFHENKNSSFLCVFGNSLVCVLEEQCRNLFFIEMWFGTMIC